MCQQSTTIDVLVPTYQRAEPLKKTLMSLVDLIRSEAPGRVRVCVRDNKSQDGTLKMLHEFAAKHDDIEWDLASNEENIGGEGNCLELLQCATAPFIMFLGDDDFLPQGYLSFCITETEATPETHVVIPGFSELRSDGSVLCVRKMTSEVSRYSPGYHGAEQLMPLGHQLSGLMFKRANLAASYLDTVVRRNLYPFIYFIGYTSQTGGGVYAPKFQVLVSQGAVRHWNYDRSALLRDMLINYESLFANKPLVRWRLQFALLRRNWARLGGSRISRFPSAFSHIVFWKRLDHLTRVTLILLAPFVLLRASAGSLVYLIRGRKSSHDMMESAGKASA